MLPAVKPVIVVVVPVPVEVAPPGETVTVHVPDDGKPLNATSPVGVVHVGCVIVPIAGATGVGGGLFITAVVDEEDVQVPLLTVKV